MNLAEHYRQLYQSSIRKIEMGDYLTDALIDSPTDQRFGITLLTRPSEQVKYKIQLFLSVLKQADPSQYYYPDTDIHITVLSIISCYEGFQLHQISTPEYIGLVKESLSETNSFKIRFSGITASESGVMLQGFPENDMLNNLRNNLRGNFKSSGLEQSIDKRYSIQTAHATVVRFRKQLQHTNQFLEVLKRFENFDFGSSEVKELELVYNDWYQREQNSKLLEKFSI